MVNSGSTDRLTTPGGRNGGEFLNTRSSLAILTLMCAAWPHTTLGATESAQAANRVLQVEGLNGAVTIRRAGRDITAQPGYLVFNEERVTAAAGARAKLTLASYGRLDLVSIDRLDASLMTERLPYSVSSADLSTRFRLDAGALAVRWTRPAAAQISSSSWPVSILMGEWSVVLSSGEYLFRRSGENAIACNVAGSTSISDGKDWKFTLEAGKCLRLDRNPQLVDFEPTEWVGVDLPVAVPNAAERRIAAPVLVAPMRPNAGYGPATLGSGHEYSVPAGAPITQADSRSRDSVPRVDKPAEPLRGLVRTPSGDGSRVATVQPPQASPGVEPPAAPPAAPRPAQPAPAGDVALAPPPTSAGVIAPTIASQPGAEKSAKKAADALSETATAEKSAPDTVPGSSPDLAPDTEWLINVVSVSDPVDAERHRRRISAKGYRTSLRTELVRGRPSYRVVVDGLENAEAADSAVQLLSSQLGYTAAWILHKR